MFIMVITDFITYQQEKADSSLFALAVCFAIIIILLKENP